MVRQRINKATSCDGDWLSAEHKIDRIRLRIIPEDDPALDLCAGMDPPSICEWSCEDGGGASAFDIPEGTYRFDLVPITRDGSIIPESIISLPAPLRRTIVEGDITDLGIWQLVILDNANPDS